MKRKMPLHLWPSRMGHHVINPIAHKLVPLKQAQGKNAHWIWKLNNWVASPWVDWWVFARFGKTRADYEKELKK